MNDVPLTQGLKCWSACDNPTVTSSVPIIRQPRPSAVYSCC